MISIFHHPHCKPHILHPIESIKCFFTSLKWAYQRVKKGYCDKDLLVGVDDWFVEMLPEVVDEIRKEKCTIPCPVIDEAIEAMGLNWEDYYDACSDTPLEIREEIASKAKKNWDDILIRISFLFREVRFWTCTKQNPYEQEYFEACKNGKNKVENSEFDALKKRYFEEDDKLREYRAQCKQEAIELTLKWAKYLEI